MITFQEQYNKITKAYYKNELNPMDGCACFIGTLLNNDNSWEAVRLCDTRLGYFYESFKITMMYNEKLETWVTKEEAIIFITKTSENLYSVKNIIDMENNFLGIWDKGNKTEDSLFKAMESTLEMLKEIHISKGEVIQDYNFTKRELV